MAKMNEAIVTILGKHCSAHVNRAVDKHRPSYLMPHIHRFAAVIVRPTALSSRLRKHEPKDNKCDIGKQDPGSETASVIRACP